MLTSIWSRISRFSNELLETRQDQDFINKDIEKGKNQDLAYREGNENNKMQEIGKIENILLYSSVLGKIDIFELSFGTPRQVLTHKNWMIGEN
jgi:hypothetical protein